MKKPKAQLTRILQGGFLEGTYSAIMKRTQAPHKLVTYEYVSVSATANAPKAAKVVGYTPGSY